MIIANGPLSFEEEMCVYMYIRETDCRHASDRLLFDAPSTHRLPRFLPSLA